MFEDDDDIVGEIRADAPEDQESDEDILALAKADFERVVEDEADKDNKDAWIADTYFAQLGKQWAPEAIEERQRQGKPTLTYNKLNAVIRQVVNDARQNKPSIKVLPVDDTADPETADILAGLIRNIEYTSKASVAYDTGAEHAAAGGHGYWQVVLDYARNDSYDLDLLIKRIINPCSVYGDPDSEAADSSDWNTAYIVERYSKTKFEREFGKDVGHVDWEGGRYGALKSPWKNDDGILVANHWRRKEVQRSVVIMSDGSVIDKEAFTPELAMTLEAEGQIAPVREVTRPSYEVWQYIMTGAEVLRRTKWPGQYIPIVPVYGNEYIVEGRRYFRGVIHDAKDAQQAYNFWRSTSTELVALAPKAPWVAQKGSIAPEDAAKWESSNRINHTVLEFEGPNPPQRMPMDMGTPAGAINEALSAADDIKAITGIYDASLGARSNETSGVAINARKVEGDTSTFNFPDNVARAINHTGVILLDVIPKVYGRDRIIRVLGEDETPETKAIGVEMPVMDPETGQPQMQQEVDPNTGQPVVDPETGEPVMIPMTRILDLTVGKYDIAVQTGPSYTTRRQEALQHMTEIFKTVPDAAQAALDIYMKATDMPMADELSKRFKEHFNLGGPSPETQQLQGQLEEMGGQLEQAGAQMQQLQAENEQLKSKADAEAQQFQIKAQLDMEKLAVEREKLALERESLQLEQHKLQLEAQKIAADLEKARIAAQASRPMMLQPAPQAAVQPEMMTY
jgi:hypothetical protein